MHVEPNQHPLGLNGGTLPGTRCEDGVSCNCSALPRCPTDRASVFLVADERGDPRSFVLHNSPNGVVVPSGFRMLCHAPTELGEKMFGCDMTTTKNVYDCIAGSKGATVCPYGTAALSFQDRQFRNASTSAYCIYRPTCAAGKVLHYDAKTKKSLCLDAQQTGSTV